MDEIHFFYSNHFIRKLTSDGQNWIGMDRGDLRNLSPSNPKIKKPITKPIKRRNTLKIKKPIRNFGFINKVFF